jgi:hypothetical protein
VIQVVESEVREVDRVSVAWPVRVRRPAWHGPRISRRAGFRVWALSAAALMLGAVACGDEEEEGDEEEDD